MLDRIIEILNEWDPIELIAIGCPDDEYEPEAKAILAEMEKTSDETRLAKKIYNIFKTSFGHGAFLPDYQECLSVARKCLAVRE